MGSTLFGSAPSATTRPTISGGQQAALGVAGNMLSAGVPGATNLGTTSLAALENLANAVPTGATPQQGSAIDSAFNSLIRNLGYNAPSVSAPQVSAPPLIDATSAFKTGVVDPLTQDFLTRVLPSIAGNAGASAGGAFSSPRAQAGEQASTDLARTLAGAGSQFALNAATANQGSQLQTNQLNIGSLLSSLLANQSASLQGAGVQERAGALAPSTLPLTTMPLATDIGLAGATSQPYYQTIADIIAGATSPTQQTVGLGGSTGLIPGLLGGVGSVLGQGTNLSDTFNFLSTFL